MTWQERGIKPVLEGIEKKLEDPNVLVVGETWGNKFIETFVSEEGGNYAHASDADEALDYLKENNADLIIASYDQHKSLISGLNGDNVPLLVESEENPHFRNGNKQRFDFESLDAEVQERLLSYDGFTGLIPHKTWPVQYNGSICHPTTSEVLEKFITTKSKENGYVPHEPAKAETPKI